MKEFEVAIRNLVEAKRRFKQDCVDVIPRDVLLKRLEAKSESNEACKELLKRIKEDSSTLEEYILKNRVASLTEFIASVQKDSNSKFHIAGKTNSDFHGFTIS